MGRTAASLACRLGGMGVEGVPGPPGDLIPFPKPGGPPRPNVRCGVGVGLICGIEGADIEVGRSFGGAGSGLGVGKSETDSRSSAVFSLAGSAGGLERSAVDEDG